MSELKKYWDKIEGYDSSQINVEASLDNVLSKINRRQRVLRGGAFAIVPLLLICTVVFLHNQPQPQMLQCYAAPGEQSTLELSDGSIVTLNSGSSLVYSSVYGKGDRSVVLSGEAKFEVAKDPRHPFVVKTRDFDVTVLGTVFNVSNYPGAGVSSVVLESGSVKINHGESEMRLVPGEKAEFTRDGSVSVSKISTDDCFNWTKGGFALKSAGIDEIISMIENAYAVTVRCSYSRKYADACITARSERPQSLVQFLSLLRELIPGMEYSIDGDIVTLN